MRKRLSKLPSPAMAVAFVALLAALTGTAVALPGSNTVTQGDLVNNSVGKGEIKTNGVGKAELRANAAGASEVNEASLGTVPTATLAGSANRAGVANFAGSAVSAGFVSGHRNSGQVSANDGERKRILAFGGWEIVLDCGVEVAGEGQIRLGNLSAGDDSHMDDNLNGDEDNDFDEGDETDLTSEALADDSENSAFSATGSAGSAVHGQTYIVNEPSYSGADCVGSASVQGNF